MNVFEYVVLKNMYIYIPSIYLYTIGIYSMLQGSNSFFETPKPQFVSSCVQVLDVDSENVKAPRISRNFSVQEKDVMLGENLPKKKTVDDRRDDCDDRRDLFI